MGYDFKEDAQDENRFPGCFWDFEGMWYVFCVTLDIIIRGIDLDVSFVHIRMLPCTPCLRPHMIFGIHVHILLRVVTYHSS